MNFADLKAVPHLCTFSSFLAIHVKLFKLYCSDVVKYIESCKLNKTLLKSVSEMKRATRRDHHITRSLYLSVLLHVRKHTIPKYCACCKSFCLTRVHQTPSVTVWELHKC
jgi:hypothetical protein